MDIAIVGAGAAGLAAASVLQKDHNVTIFEQNAQLGGLWNDRDGFDQTPLYPSLRTNLPIQLMQYPNFDYAQLSPPSEPPEFDNYPSSPRILEYLEAFAEEHDLVARIRFKAKVNRLIPTHDHWTIHYGDKACASADAVVVCNGHYSVPNVPLLAGMDSFDGRLLHAREYIGPEGFSGQKVVVWGGNASALDLVREISGTASHLFWCGHAPAMSDIAADLARVSVCADPSRIAGSTVTLSSGEALEDVDVILMCTGYHYAFPFLDPELIAVDNNLVQPLYRQILSTRAPRLAFIGLPFLVIPFPLFLIQSQWLGAMFKDPSKLPAQSAMHRESQREIDDHLNRGLLKRHFHQLGQRQLNYLKQLIADANLDPLPDRFIDLLLEVQQLRQNHPTHYRKMAITSPDPSHRPPA